MFKAAGRPGPVVQGKRANEWEEKRQELCMHASQRFIKGPQWSLSSKLSGKSLNFWRRREIIRPYGWHHCIYSEPYWGATRWYKGGSKGAAILLLRSGGIIKKSLLYTADSNISNSDTCNMTAEMYVFGLWLLKYKQTFLQADRGVYCHLLWQYTTKHTLGHTLITRSIPLPCFYKWTRKRVP